MIYRSNLTCPDLQPHFKALCYPRPYSMGHDVMSDPDFEPECGFMTHDEAAILTFCAMRSQGRWMDIGSRTGWSTMHIWKACADDVDAVDQGYANPMLLDRAKENLKETDAITFYTCPSQNMLFGRMDYESEWDYAGICIDGCHDHPLPLLDANGALMHLAETGCIVFHDFWGLPIREGVEWLMSQGMKCRVYNTPNGMAVCWRGDFVPPEHVPDPGIDWRQVRKSRAPEFDFSRTV